jgi:hypothetical protein
MVEVLRGDPQEVVIRVSGTLGDGAGAQLASCLGGLGSTVRLVVDFSPAHSLCDADLGALARPLAGRANVRIRGLCLHHLRLLRYCGVHVHAHARGGDREG